MSVTAGLHIMRVWVITMMLGKPIRSAVIVGAQWVGGQHWYWSRHKEVNRAVWTHTLSQHMLCVKSSSTSSSSITGTCTHSSQGCHFSVNSSAKQWVTTAVLPQRIFVWVTGFIQHKQTNNTTHYMARQTLLVKQCVLKAFSWETKKSVRPIFQCEVHTCCDSYFNNAEVPANLVD